MANTEHNEILKSIFRDSGFDADIIDDKVVVGLTSRSVTYYELQEVLYLNELEKMVEIHRKNDNDYYLEVL